MKKIKIALIWKVLIACVFGCVLGRFLPAWFIRIFTTFNYVFGQYISFIVPLIIVGLVTPAICRMGSEAGKALLFTVILAYLSSVLAGVFSYSVGTFTFPELLGNTTMPVEEDPTDSTVAPYFTINIPAIMDIMSALVFSFLFGTLLTTTGKGRFKDVVFDFEEMVTKAISITLIPFLPVYIFGLFLKMSYSNDAMPVMAVFAKIIVVIFVMTVGWLVFMFCISGLITRKNPFRSIVNMLPAYMTALGTASSAATIPVTMDSVKKCGVSDPVAKFTVPLCATIHMPGSIIKVTACALTIMMLQGIPFNFSLILQFIMMLAVTAVAAPGVPGGVIMASLGVLASVLGFDESNQAMMITLYIIMDSFGTAANVTGDGAITMIVDKFLNTNFNQDSKGGEANACTPSR